jgi:hypothetical protein
MNFDLSQTSQRETSNLLSCFPADCFNYQPEPRRNGERGATSVYNYLSTDPAKGEQEERLVFSGKRVDFKPLSVFNDCSLLRIPRRSRFPALNVSDRRRSVEL